ncbi:MULTISPECIES: LysR family transcriptional regulator [Roseobacteraceae]|uniref:HTH-type transcriptional regulator YofA n=1 Tax=Pseudosulfitobacter pseudonitzschiae TaxID=1402135 RepID=A0A221K5T1_9RHOB|nr:MULTISPECIES: LysR family transcriptional regulator [Roseobacteraceae]ASM74361.1 HTH-type transcriptional regulator YofA [Pseudosulfitobacter pseudonitzschiae]
MNNKLDWNDYEIVLRIADAGSLSKAAHLAGSSHPTMFRRINAVEEKLGVRLFERFRTGYQPTAAGEDLVSVARQIAELTNDTERRISGRDLRPSGVVRVATTDTLLFGLLAREIVLFRKLEPGITLDIAVANEISNLSLREADIAIRPASSPDDHLIGRKLGPIRQAVYAVRTLDLGQNPQPPWTTLPWIGPSPSMAYSQLHAWMRNVGCDEKCVCHLDSVLAIYAAVRTGVGVAVLPCYLAETDSELTRIGNPIDELAVDLWLLTHPDLRHSARVRTALNFFGKLGAIL